MNNESTQLSLNLIIDTDAPQGTDDQHIASKPTIKPQSATVVSFSSFLDQRSKAQQLEEERILMDSIRSQVEHLQA